LIHFDINIPIQLKSSTQKYGLYNNVIAIVSFLYLPMCSFPVNIADEVEVPTV